MGTVFVFFTVCVWGLGRGSKGGGGGGGEVFLWPFSALFFEEPQFPLVSS